MSENAKLDLILEKVVSMDNRLQNVEGRLQDVDDRLQDVEKDVNDVKLILENEIRVNIQRIAEGHLDLSRNMHDAMRPSNEVEMLAIQVRMHETDIRELKSRIS